MTLLEWAYLTALIAGSVMVLNDAINGVTAAVRELVQVCRRDKP